MKKVISIFLFSILTLLVINSNDISKPLKSSLDKPLESSLEVNKENENTTTNKEVDDLIKRNIIPNAEQTQNNNQKEK